MKPEHLKLLRDRFWRLNNLYFITDKQGNKVRFRRRRNRSITSKGCTHLLLPAARVHLEECHRMQVARQLVEKDRLLFP